MSFAIVSAAFKDVYSPLEACKMITKILPQDAKKVIIPFCDGGEYTYEVLLNIGGYKEIIVKNVRNSYLELTDGKYLIFQDEAHIVSSEILRLHPNDDDKKNPLKLSDFGYGQLVKHALDCGFKKIYLYWGGTSTVGFGVGFAQALGVDFYDENGKLFDKPIITEDISRISYFKSRKEKYGDVEVKIIVDGDARFYEMSNITELKIGKKYKKNTEDILSVTNAGMKKVISLCQFDKNKPYSGAAGGLLFGTELCFSPQYYLGGDYFSKLLHVSDQIDCCEYVITGEGRYDNSACGKAAVFITRIAKREGKKTILVCGQVDKNKFSRYADGIIHGDQYEELHENGIDLMITCQEYYDKYLPADSYEEQIKYYRANTDIILKKVCEKVF